MRLLQDKERTELEILRAKSKEKKLYVRYTSILMYDDGLTYHQIARFLGIGDKTPQRAVEAYRSGGIEEVSRYYYVGHAGSLSSFEESILVAELKENLYLTSAEVALFIKETFDIEYSNSGVCKLLKRLGFVYKQTKLIPGKADFDKQTEMVEELVELVNQLDKEAKAYFLDGVHPTHNTTNCRAWILKGEEYELTANSGRQRLNINGAMNAIEPTEMYVDYTDSVNSQSTQRLIDQILASNKESKTIYLISDNARYYRNKELQEYINENSKIRWIFLPPYSPNLNLIERMWKYMRKVVLNGYYYDTFDKFKREIIKFFDNLKEHELGLKSLITFNFQLFSQT